MTTGKHNYKSISIRKQLYGDTEKALVVATSLFSNSHNHQQHDIKHSKDFTQKLFNFYIEQQIAFSKEAPYKTMTFTILGRLTI